MALKRTLKTSYLLVFLLFAIQANAQDKEYPYNVEGIPDIVAQNELIANPDGILTEAEEESARSILVDLGQMIGTEVYLVVLASKLHEIPPDLITDLLKKWGVWTDDDESEGAVLMVLDGYEIYGLSITCGDKADKYWSEEAKAAIQNDFMAPAFQQGEYSLGINNALNALALISNGTTVERLYELYPEAAANRETSVFDFSNDIPNPMKSGRDFVEDLSGQLEDKEIQRMNNTIRGIKALVDIDVAIVILESAEGNDLNRVADHLFSIWDIDGQLFSERTSLLWLVNLDSSHIFAKWNFAEEFELSKEVMLAIMEDHILADIDEKGVAASLQHGLETIRKALRDSDFRDKLADPAERKQLAEERILKDLTKDWKAENETLSLEEELYSERKGSWFSWLLSLYLFGLAIYTVIGFALLKVTSDLKGDLYRQYQNLSNFNRTFWVFIFPLPAIWLTKSFKERLHKIRHSPRFSPKNGKKMFYKMGKIRHEYMNDAQIEQETAKTASFDVWVTNDSDDVLILKYPPK